MNKIKQHPYLLFFSITCLVLGLWFILDNPAKIYRLIYGFIGISLIVTGTSKVLLNDPKYTYDGMLNIVTGVLIMFLHNYILTIIFGVIFLVFPLYRIWISNDKKYAFKREMLYLIFGLVVVLCGDIFAFVLVKIIGILFLIFAVLLFIMIFTAKVYKEFMFFGEDVSNSLGFDNVIDVDYEESDDNE